ncbi:uncharacterized protein LOC101848031 [Aplysia californica]|uniref:Uncharacterized protein LOC101848031 n=1 Tax=Aplysia californica TaxID=6500 RepID=A0ABM0ZWM6_APLCA|nr:uncharacterized protein LOC101848031 [Aplysia californica]
MFLFCLFAFLPVSRTDDNCGWPRDTHKISQPLTLWRPNISSINTSTESCKAKFESTDHEGTVVMVTRSFNLSRSRSKSGWCGEDSERLEITNRLNSPRYLKTWCGEEYAEILYFPRGLTLTYYPGTKGQGSGFELEIVPNFMDLHVCENENHLKAVDTPKFLYRYTRSRSESVSCTRNMVAEDGKIVLIRSFGNQRNQHYGLWLPFDEKSEPVDFVNLNTSDSSVEIDEADFPYSPDDTLLAEYVSASTAHVDCVDSTAVEIALGSEEMFIQLSSNTTRCSLRFTASSPDDAVDLSLVTAVVNDTASREETEFVVEYTDGSKTFINSSRVNQQPFRRVQSAHSSVTLTYKNLEVNEGNRSNIHAWVRAVARSPDVLPRHLRSTRVKSFLWIPGELLSRSETPQLQMFNNQKCVRLQVLDQALTTSYIPADFLSVYHGL